MQLIFFFVQNNTTLWEIRKKSWISFVPKWKTWRTHYQINLSRKFCWQLFGIRCNLNAVVGRYWLVVLNKFTLFVSPRGIFNIFGPKYLHTTYSFNFLLLVFINFFHWTLSIIAPNLKKKHSVFQNIGLFTWWILGIINDHIMIVYSTLCVCRKVQLLKKFSLVWTHVKYFLRQFLIRMKEGDAPSWAYQPKTPFHV